MRTILEKTSLEEEDVDDSEEEEILEELPRLKISQMLFECIRNLYIENR